MIDDFMLSCFFFHQVGRPSEEPTYSSYLSTSHQTYSRDCSIMNYYYEAIQLNVTTTGTYFILIIGPFWIHADIYRNNFNSLNPLENLLQQYGFMYAGDADRLRFQLELRSDIVYVLVVTTDMEFVTGPFSIYISGPKNISLRKMSKCRYLLA